MSALPEGWVETTVRELVATNVLCKPLDGNHGGIHPKGDDFVPEGVPFVMASDLKGGKVDLVNCSFISRKQADSLRKGFAKNGDVLLSHKATIGRTALLKTSLDYIMLTPQVTYYRINDSSKLSNNFLKYYFDSPRFQSTLLSYAGGGSTRLYIGITSQLDLPMVIPTFHEQKAIADMLSSFDEKIKLLREQNKTLEALAQTIFKEWFVNFNYPDATGDMVDSELGEIPKGWRVSGIRGLVEHVKNNIKPFDYPDKEYQHFSIPAFDSGKKPELHCGSEISSNKYAVVDNSFLVSKLNPSTPRIWTVLNPLADSVCSTEFQVLKPKNYTLFGFIYGALTSYGHRRELSARAHGTSSSHQRVSPDDILDAPIAIPSKGLIESYSEIVNSLLEKADNNLGQINSLSKARASLLPKLMSGKLRLYEPSSQYGKEQ